MRAFGTDRAKCIGFLFKPKAVGLDRCKTSCFDFLSRAGNFNWSSDNPF